MSADRKEATRSSAPLPQPERVRELLKAQLALPTFGLPFFGTFLSGRFQDHCSGAGPDVSQVLLHLAGGAVLDVCHVAEFTPRWVAVAAFRDDRACERMDVECVPYELIHRVTISSRPAEERKLGFDLQRSQAALQAASKPKGLRDDSPS